ncbi:hypothetical protein C0J52_26432, partial [Blattella germanica]
EALEFIGQHESSWYTTFRTVGSLKDKSPPGPRRTVSTPENRERVRLSAIRSSKRSALPHSVYKSVIEPVLLYGGENWTVGGRDIRSVGTVEMKCYRRIMGKTRRDRIRNDRIRESLKQEKRQLKWFGHVVRMDERSKPKQIMEARVEGTRTRGRPRKGYMDRIEDIARKKGKGVGELKRLARNREEWRKLSYQGFNKWNCASYFGKLSGTALLCRKMSLGNGSKYNPWNEEKREGRRRATQRSLCMTPAAGSD